jgi:hypothetical protein
MAVVVTMSKAEDPVRRDISIEAAAAGILDRRSSGAMTMECVAMPLFEWV